MVHGGLAMLKHLVQYQVENENIIRPVPAGEKLSEASLCNKYHAFLYPTELQKIAHYFIKLQSFANGNSRTLSMP
jgi:hypothetical protein